ncbi:hypothetical protein ACLQ85_07165 [Gallibacterium anatis]
MIILDNITDRIFGKNTEGFQNIMEYMNSDQCFINALENEIDNIIEETNWVERSIHVLAKGNKAIIDLIETYTSQNAHKEECNDKELFEKLYEIPKEYRSKLPRGLIVFHGSPSKEIPGKILKPFSVSLSDRIAHKFKRMDKMEGDVWIIDVQSDNVEGIFIGPGPIVNEYEFLILSSHSIIPVPTPTENKGIRYISIVDTKEA